MFILLILQRYISTSTLTFNRPSLLLAVSIKQDSNQTNKREQTRMNELVSIDVQTVSRVLTDSLKEVVHSRCLFMLGLDEGWS